MPGVGPMRTSVTYSGPLFQRDPQKTILQNTHKLMEQIADEGAEAARIGLRSGEASRDLIRELGDRVSDHVIGRVRSRAGKEWTAAAVVQVYNEGMSATESRSLMAAASIVEGRTHAIKTVYRQLQSSRAALRANLTQGIE